MMKRNKWSLSHFFVKNKISQIQVILLLLDLISNSEEQEKWITQDVPRFVGARAEALAPKVHDFTWSADPDYIHDTFKGPNNVLLHFFYKDNPINTIKVLW